MMRLRAPIALSLGDPSGIGPEVAAAAWRQLRGELAMFALGDPHCLAATGVPVRVIDDPAEAHVPDSRAFAILPIPLSGQARPGRPDPAHAQGVIEAIETGARLTLSGAASSLCTAPINKRTLREGAGFAFPGHTEFLAALCGVARPVMMLAGPDLRVVPVTIHIALAAVVETLTAPLLEETLRITHAALIAHFGLQAPRIAVAGLNPHAGEAGQMGREEIVLIRPVIERLRATGMDLRGPLPADTLFHPAARAGYDAAVCMYHDQALIPIKTLSFDAGVNLTLGLPIVRTSPDHGTAYDIAGTGRANPASMIAALRMADALASRRAQANGRGQDG
ncbi:MAG: 4-hydroxythreonine-4-phosphate dehydrogenase PdxA [Pseudomonadota bacterium]